MHNRHNNEEVLPPTNRYVTLMHVSGILSGGLGPQPVSLSPQDMFALPDDIKQAILTSEVY